MDAQFSLLGNDAPAFDPGFHGLHHHALDAGAWVEHCIGWLAGDIALLDELRHTTRWCSERRSMFDRVVEVPRLTARYPEHGPGHPIMASMADALSARYAEPLHAISANWYRDGRDSVALHGDRVGRARDECVVAIVSLGEARRFLLKPLGDGRSRGFRLGHGDLLVMGGQCQRTWQHGVPKVARAGSRISLQFRPQALEA